MWAIIMLATKQGLRHDEFHEIEMKHFLPRLFEVPESEDRIIALAMKVFGKSDESWVNMKIHADDVYPDLCPVRPLLIYMHLIGIKGGISFRLLRNSRTHLLMVSTRQKFAMKPSWFSLSFYAQTSFLPEKA